jgi:hypothetical protein
MLRAWREQVGTGAAKQQRTMCARRLRECRLLRQALGSWLYINWFKRTARVAQREQAQRTAASVMAVWRQRAALAAATAAVLAVMAQLRRSRLVARSFDGWAAFLAGRQSWMQAEDVER